MLNEFRRVNLGVKFVGLVKPMQDVPKGGKRPRGRNVANCRWIVVAHHKQVAPKVHIRSAWAYPCHNEAAGLRLRCRNL